MQIKLQLGIFLAIMRHEFTRMLRINSQIFLPPIISSSLYFLIFGTIIGERLGSIQGVDYSEFIAPGLVMMAVINSAYANVCGSLFTARFQRSIEELQVSPVHDGIFLLGFVMGGIIRGLIVAISIFIVSAFFMDLHLKNILLTLSVVIFISAVFALAGFINGLLARTFDDIAFVPTFILSPMIYLGGVFYSADMLSPFWHNVTLFNPIYYIINIMRATMLGNQNVNLALSMSVIILTLMLCVGINLILLKKGIGLRS